MWVFPLAATAISVTFFGVLLRSWSARRSPQLLAWAIALLMFTLASAAVLVGTSTEWTPGWFRIYYLFGAIANVPVLALGTLYLLTPRRFAHGCAALVAGATALAAIAVSRVDLTATSLDATGIPAAADVVTPAIRWLSRIYSFTGFFVVVGGAIWSAVKPGGRDRGADGKLVAANFLIALGTLVVAVGSTFARYGQGSVFAAGLALGIGLMFAGFLRARAPATR